MSIDWRGLGGNKVFKQPIKVWKLIFVGHETDFYASATVFLQDLTFQNIPLECLVEPTLTKAKALLRHYPETAVVILSVKSAEADEVLSFLSFIRHELNNKMLRLVLRVEDALEPVLWIGYDLHAVQNISTSSQLQLFCQVHSALNVYMDALLVQKNLTELKSLNEWCARAAFVYTAEHWLQMVIEQFVILLGGCCHLVAASPSSQFKEESVGALSVLGGYGKYQGSRGQWLHELLAPVKVIFLQQAKAFRPISFGERDFCCYFSSRTGEAVFLYGSGLVAPLMGAQKELLELYSHAAQQAFERIQAQQDLEKCQREIIERLSDLAEPSIKGRAHLASRMAAICYELAKGYGLSEEESTLLKWAAPLYNLGKLRLPHELLHKPEKLLEDEWELMKTYPVLGYQLLKDSKQRIVQAGALIAYEHQEKWDGSGYPEGKKGQNIHVFARIAALADVYNALRHPRVYGPAWPKETVILHIESETNTHFEPKLVEIFKACVDKLEAILQKYPDEA